MKKILFAASEAVPFMKTGGLADVTGSLPKYFDKKNYDVRVILPKYVCMEERWKGQLHFLCHFYVNLSWRKQYVGIFETTYDGITYYLVDNEFYFAGNAPYNNIYEDVEKFAFFSKAVLEALPYLDFCPDIIHCHDWQTGLLPVFLRTLYGDEEYYTGVEMVRSGGRFQPQDIQQGTDGQSGFAASKENEDVQTTIPMQSAAPQKESAPPENLSVFNSLLPKKETAVTEQSADRVSESNTYTVSKPVPQPIQADKTTASLPEETAAALPESKVTYEQQELAAVSEGFLTKDAKKKHKIIGQLFDTYWMVEYEDKLFIIDQHAAHEKVLYEKTMKKVREKTFSSQTLSPPIILTLSIEEIEMLEKYREQIDAFGYEIEPFGGKEYAVTAIPADFTGIDTKTMFLEMLDDFANINENDSPNAIMEKVASMSCKAAIKGNQHISRPEAERLIDELLELENPYNCPHGRPTIISMTKYEIEKKFKRIV